MELLKEKSKQRRLSGKNSLAANIFASHLVAIHNDELSYACVKWFIKEKGQKKREDNTGHAVWV